MNYSFLLLLLLLVPWYGALFYCCWELHRTCVAYRNAMTDIQQTLHRMQESLERIEGTLDNLQGHYQNMEGPLNELAELSRSVSHRRAA